MLSEILFLFVLPARADKTLIDHYAQMLTGRREILNSLSKYLAVDGYFAKKGFIDAMLQQAGLQVIQQTVQ